MTAPAETVGRVAALRNRVRWAASRHLGLPAVLAAVIGIAAVGLQSQWLPGLQAERARIALRQKARLAERSVQPEAQAQTPESASRAWLQSLPGADRRGATVALLLRRAVAAGLRVERADYAVQDDAVLPVSHLTVSLPVTGTYGQVRAGVAAVLEELPSAALESLQLERSDTRSPQLRATAQFVVHFRQVSP